MGKLNKKRASLEELLASISSVLFPASMGESPVYIDSADSDGDTPLHVFIWQKNRYAVDLLVAAGANVNAIGDMGQTPLHVAITQADIVIIEILLKAGAKSDIRSEFNRTALEAALESGGEIAKLFSKKY